MTNEMNLNGKASNQEMKNRQGRCIAYWFPLGIGTGVALGVLFENLALGIAIGGVLGIVLGTAASSHGPNAEMRDAGTSGRRWIYGIAVAGGLLLLAGIIILFGILTR